ncbi:MAG: type II toxin-antitoxin system HicB family antitoxin [Terriglobia bacterium]
METRVKLKYLVVVETAKKNFAAYVPDLPGCIATGSTLEEVHANIRSAIAMHVEGLREDGILVLEPQTQVEFIEA